MPQDSLYVKLKAKVYISVKKTFAMAWDTPHLPIWNIHVPNQKLEVVEEYDKMLKMLKVNNKSTKTSVFVVNFEQIVSPW